MKGVYKERSQEFPEECFGEKLPASVAQFISKIPTTEEFRFQLLRAITNILNQKQNHFTVKWQGCLNENNKGFLEGFDVFLSDKKVLISIRWTELSEHYLTEFHHDH